MLCPGINEQQPGDIYHQVWQHYTAVQVSLDPFKHFLREEFLKFRAREFFMSISHDEVNDRLTFYAAKRRPSGQDLLAFFPVKVTLFNVEKDPFWLIDNDSIRDAFYYPWSFDEGFLPPFWLEWAVLNLANGIDESSFSFLTYPFALPKYLLKQNKRGEIPKSCNLSLPLFSEADFVRFASVPVDGVGTTVIKFPAGPRVFYSATSFSDVLELPLNFARSEYATDQQDSTMDVRASLLGSAVQGGGFVNVQIPPIVLESSRDTLLLFLFLTAAGVYLRKNKNHLINQFKEFEPVCEKVSELGLQGLCVARHGDGPFGVTTLIILFNGKIFRVDLPELLRLRTLRLDEADLTLNFIFSRKLAGLPRQDCVLSFDPKEKVFTLNPSSERLGLKRHYGIDLEWTEHKLLWFRLYQALDSKLSERVEDNLVPPKICGQTDRLWINQAPYLFALANIGTPYDNFFNKCVFPDWSKQAS
jgi:hypothetical protein